MGASDQGHVCIVGGGFTGMAVAYELLRRGVRSTILERGESPGGLAGSFSVPGGRLEKFYHHWFVSDEDAFALVRELGLGDRLAARQTRTDLYYANTSYRLSSPLDLLRFKPLSLRDRIRLGLLVIRSRRVTDSRTLEHLTARQWLTELAGPAVYRIVWEPLLAGKFGDAADDVSATWMCHKLKLRGGSRSGRGGERLVYLDGGFGVLVDRLQRTLEDGGVELRLGRSVDRVVCEGGRAVAVECGGQFIAADAVVVTTAIPEFVSLCPELPADYRARLAGIRYLGNICIVLALDRSLSETYWTNVNDPAFPFVGVIEHTNMQPPSAYEGLHFVYLSRYLPHGDGWWKLGDDEIVALCMPHLRRMFPQFDRAWIRRSFVWRARYAQPIITRNYSRMIPDFQTPVAGLWLCTMAQIYPEDRGTNYAIAYGRRLARRLAENLAENGRSASGPIESPESSQIPSSELAPGPARR